MRTPIVVGNWKMNGVSKTCIALAEDLKRGNQSTPVEVAVCPPFPYLSAVNAALFDCDIMLGAQDCATAIDGAYTGQVSSKMLHDVGCRWVIIGHSERRMLCNETDDLLADKLRCALETGLRPIFCVGETESEYENGRSIDVVQAQLGVLLDVMREHPDTEVVIAYEPVWAIGTGRTATPEQAQNVHAVIREQLIEFNADIANRTRILYGGSVKSSNARQLFDCEDVDGALVGGASLKATDFIEIIQAAAGTLN